MKNLSIGKRLALGLLIILAFWFVIGALFETGAVQTQEQISQPALVAAVASVAKTYQPIITLRGELLADSSATIRSEVEGQVVKIMAKEGAIVKKSQPLIEIATNAKSAELSEAKARFRQESIEYTAAKRLNREGYSSKTSLASAKAEYEAAEAALRRAQLNADKRFVRASFSGSFENRIVDVGDFVKVGDELGRIVGSNALKFQGYVAEKFRSQLPDIGQSLTLTVGGKDIRGTVKYIARTKTEFSNAYQFEADIADAQNLYPGQLAEAEIPGKSVKAHQLSSAYLALDNAGILGIKALNQDNKVLFYPVKIAASDGGIVWLYDVPQQLNIITTGHEFVDIGSTVKAEFSK